MAEIHLEKKERSGWIWVLVALIVALVLLWAVFATDDAAETSRAGADVAAVADWLAEEPAHLSSRAGIRAHSP
jgi:hypothetical protein